MVRWTGPLRSSNEHAQIAAAFRLSTPKSPIRASFAATQHVMSRAKSRVPLAMLLDQLESSMWRLTSPSPEKRVPGFARAKLGHKVTGPGTAKATAAASTTATAAAALPAKTPTPRLVASAPALASRDSHVRRHVLELYENYIEHQRRQQAPPVRARPPSARLERPSSAATGAVEHRRARPSSAALPPPGSFLEVVRLYYPTYSRATLEAMIEDARPGMEDVDRRQWVSHTKVVFANKVKLAFLKSDADKSGGLDCDEFIAAVKEACTAKPAERSDGGQRSLRARSSTPMPTPEELKRLFASADADGNGVLDLDEFVELCARQPWIVQAFEAVVETGLRRRRAREEARLSTLFRHPISPLSRAIHEPSGTRRFRPSLHDLRPTADVEEELRMTTKWS